MPVDEVGTELRAVGQADGGTIDAADEDPFHGILRSGRWAHVRVSARFDEAAAFGRCGAHQGGLLAEGTVAEIRAMHQSESSLENVFLTLTRTDEPGAPA